LTLAARRLVLVMAKNSVYASYTSQSHTITTSGGQLPEYLTAEKTLKGKAPLYFLM